VCKIGFIAKCTIYLQILSCRQKYQKLLYGQEIAMGAKEERASWVATIGKGRNHEE
jgi:hypothetical protein